MNGFELARQIRGEEHPDRRTRLVALSGYGQAADVEAALAAGFDDHLTKPPDMERLEALLGVAGRAVAGEAGSGNGRPTDDEMV